MGVIEKAAALFVSEVVEAGSAAAQGEARLRALFTRWLSWSRGPRLKGGCPFVHASAESDALPATVRSKLEQFMTDWSATLKASIEDAKAAEQLPPVADAINSFSSFTVSYLSHHFLALVDERPHCTGADASCLRAVDAGNPRLSFQISAVASTRAAGQTVGVPRGAVVRLRLRKRARAPFEPDPGHAGEGTDALPANLRPGLSPFIGVMN